MQSIGATSAIKDDGSKKKFHSESIPESDTEPPAGDVTKEVTKKELDNPDYIEVFTHPAVPVFRVRRFERFLIFYRPARKCIEILRVLHSSGAGLALCERRGHG
jgi:hypothetical protein